jgi:hypothetical protein
LASAAIFGYWVAVHAATASGSACQARYSGFCGDSPIVLSIRPTLTADRATPNSRRISSRIMSRVHSANSNFSWRGSEPVTSR